MKKFLVIYLLVVFSLALSGCDGKESFNRVNAQNQYIWIYNISSAPFSRNIEEQKIIEKSDGKIQSIDEIKADKLGRVTNNDFKVPHYSASLISLSVDYSNMKFNYKVPFYLIDVDNIDFSLGDNGYIHKITSNNDLIENTYDNDNKLVSSSATFSNLPASTTDKYYWSDNLIIAQDTLEKTFSGVFNSKYSYFYDLSAKLIKIERVSVNVNSGDTKNYITRMTEFNEYGDWVKAEKIDDNGAVTDLIREIKYW